MGGAHGPSACVGQHGAVAAHHRLGLRRSGQGDSEGERDQQGAHSKLQDSPGEAAQPEHVAECDRKVNLGGVERMAGTARKHIGHTQAENTLACQARRFGPAVFAL